MAAKRAALSFKGVKHTEVAASIGIDAETLRDWVVRGLFPEPRKTVGVTWIYDYWIVEEWWASDKRPKGATFRQTS